MATHKAELLDLGEVAGGRRVDRDARAGGGRQLQFTYGHGIDEARLNRAVELEDPPGDVLNPFPASMVDALLQAWTGRLDEARTKMEAFRMCSVERGAEHNLVAVEVCRGNFAEAEQLADDAVERAELDGGSQATAASMRAMAAAYVGRQHQARADINAALEVANRVSSPRLAEWPLMTLGCLELSLGNYADALMALQPLLSAFEATPGTEIMTSSWIPDAVEAMIALGRHTEVEPLIAALEDNGHRLDRAWMLAVGARRRSIALAADDVEGAVQMAKQALVEHDRIPMRFEHARTLLWLGQLQRRQRQKECAATALREALVAFEDTGAGLWADRARAELGRTTAAPTRDLTLTPTEQQVAELAASGMTNRDVATALFISRKAFEANPSRIYRKLGIETRAELGRIIGEGQ